MLAGLSPGYPAPPGVPPGGYNLSKSSSLNVCFVEVFEKLLLLLLFKGVGLLLDVVFAGTADSRDADSKLVEERLCLVAEYGCQSDVD